MDVNSYERRDMKLTKQETIKRLFIWVVASGIYCLSVNLFYVPGGLYSGGFTGIAQLLALLFQNTSLAKYNLRGILYFIINIPVFVYGIKSIGWKSIAKAGVIVVLETIGFSLIPIPQSPIIQDVLVNTIVGGFLCGLGCGLTYLGFGLSGGTDIIGMALCKKYHKLSVAKIGLVVNVFVYGICAFIFNLDVAIYSLIAAFVSSLIADKIHLQNKSVSVNIFTDKPDDICDWIHMNLDRGATVIEGHGSYSHERKSMVVAVMSEYESRQFQHAIKEIDDKAFIFIDPSVGVIGNFNKRLS